jgi:hypothetical protein
MMPTSVGELRLTAARMPTGKSDQRRQGQGKKRQRQRDPDAVADQLGHRHLVGVADAEIAVQQPQHPGEIALQQRPIETERRAQRRHGLRRGVQPQHELRRVSRHHFEHEEDHDRGSDQAEDERDEATEDEGGHQFIAPATGAISPLAGENAVS